MTGENSWNVLLDSSFDAICKPLFSIIDTDISKVNCNIVGSRMGNPTRYMVSWDDHSTHLVARLGYLLERQQLVDVTLMCNTHSLKVHRSVLAACSPYFERELGNHPMIVLKDMKFSVLKSLIEFMYCGETNVTEDNLHALVEAAKFFEVKGLSSLAHESLQDSKSIKPPSLVGSTTSQTRICQVSSSPIPVSTIMPKVAENGNFSSPVSVIARLGQNNTTNDRRPCAGRGRPKAHLQSPCCEPLVSKPTPITPPQTESAQILLSLAGSNQSYISPSKHKTNDINPTVVNHQDFPISNGLDNNSPKFNDDLEQKYKRSRKRPADSLEENKYDIKKSMPNIDIKTEEDVNRSPLLASLLTKNDKLEEKPKVQKPQETQTQNSERYINALKGAGLPTDIPILIENGDGNYITLTENVYDILAKEDALHFQLTNVNLAHLKPPEELVSNMHEVIQSNSSILETNLEDPVIKNIKTHLPPDNPDDVVLYKVADDGNIEKYVLTTEDIKAFKESILSNPERKKDFPMLNVSEINVPLENKSSPLITKILDCGNEKFSEALLGRLPLRKRGTFKINTINSDADILQQMNNICTQSSTLSSAETDVEYVVVGEDSVQMDLMGSTNINNKNNSLKNDLKMHDVADEEMSVLEAMMNNTIEFSAGDGDYQMHSSEEVFSNDQNDNEKMILSNVLMCTGAENSNSHVGLDHFGFKPDDVDVRNGDCNQQKKSKMYVDLDLTGSDFISEPVTEEVVLSSELNPSS